MKNRDIYVVGAARTAIGSQSPRVLQFAAQLAGRLVNPSEIGRSVALDPKTLPHLRVLEQLVLCADFSPGRATSSLPRARGTRKTDPQTTVT